MLPSSVKFINHNSAEFGQTCFRRTRHLGFVGYRVIRVDLLIGDGAHHARVHGPVATLGLACRRLSLAGVELLVRAKAPGHSGVEGCPRRRRCDTPMAQSLQWCPLGPQMGAALLRLATVSTCSYIHSCASPSLFRAASPVASACSQHLGALQCRHG